MCCNAETTATKCPHAEDLLTLSNIYLPDDRKIGPPGTPHLALSAAFRRFASNARRKIPARLQIAAYIPPFGTFNIHVIGCPRLFETFSNESIFIG